MVKAISDPIVATEARELLRSLLEKIVIRPDARAPDGVALTMHDALAEALRFIRAAKRARAE